MFRIKHITLLKLICARLFDASLVFNLDKWEFGKGVVSYLLKLVGEGLVKPWDASVTGH